MTTLRDDGYLETDDPVVAACFLGKAVLQCRSDLQDYVPLDGELYQVQDNEMPFMIDRDTTLYEADSIRIPAATVAELDSKARHTVEDYLFCEGWSTMEVKTWLRTHTEDSQ